MGKKIKISAIIQARISSNRLRGKILKKIKSLSVLEILILRLKRSKKLNEIVIACSDNVADKKIINLCKKLNVKYFVGPEKNVLKRFYLAAKKFNLSNILRITSDCPLIDHKVIDKLIEKYSSGKFDYASNTLEPSYPDGLDIEIFKFDLLKERYMSSKNKFEKEHVTSGMLNANKYKLFSLKMNKNYSMLRITLDTIYDFNILKKLFIYFKYNFKINLNEILKLYDKNPSFFKKNAKVSRNGNMFLSKGQKTWIRAKKIIPGGTMLFSKNPDLMLPGKWPAYFSKAKGCNIWDLENKKFTDLYSMGIGTNILGYCNKYVDKAVTDVVRRGNMSTLNSIDEIKLAEKLVEIHPWAEMACFTRSGGEANSVAIRIARAATGKDKIAICGYHGWHDWYLSTNINNSNNLSSHLMKNLPIKGVPKNLKNTAFTFNYNDIESLKSTIRNHDIGAIKMEVMRNYEPKNNFLKKVRKLADENNIILIFDECTSGFRQEFGGMHKSYNVIPDLAIFGKALGNGYGINSIIGKKSVMNFKKSTFISSTFWTERAGPVAALETLIQMEKTKSWQKITNKGKKIKKNWKNLAKIHNLEIDVRGIDAIPNFAFNKNVNLKYKTFITQEMLKKNILASNVIYCSIVHDDHILDKYYNLLDSIFYKLSKFEDKSKNIDNFLETPLSISGLREVKD